jgi:hypothetical protein
MRSTLCILSLAVLVTIAYGQRGAVDPRNAAILQEARYLSGDGSAGAAYVQEDGIEFKEETDIDGNRKGQYSYYDPTGKLTTVHYTAGKNGFQVEGDHLPKAPPAPPVAAPQPQYQPKRQYRPQQAPVPQYNPQPQYNTIPTQNQFSYTYGDQQQQYNNNLQQFPQQQPQYYQTTTTTTPSPRFFPPGKLNLNRTPDGYQYSFSSN